MNRRLISICTSLMLLGALVTACAGAQTPDGGGSSAPEASASTPAATVPASPSLSPEPSASEPSASESPAETLASQEPEAGPVEKTYRMNKNYPEFRKYCSLKK